MAAKNGSNFTETAALVNLPARAFSVMLAEIDDLAELKVTLFCLAALQQKEGAYRHLRLGEFLEDEELMRGLAAASATVSVADTLQAALQKTLERGTLLAAEVALGGASQTLYFANDQQGRALQGQIQAGEWQPEARDEIVILPPRPTIYGLYEENFGVLTPMIVESLREAEASYPRAWIEDAMRYAVERNARNWRYVKKVLEGWQQEGRSLETNERDHGRHGKYTSGKWKDYIKS